MEQRNHRKVFVGVVTSDKAKLTATVRVETKVKHPIYKKLVIKHKNYHAHNAGDEPAKVNDRVEITETRPLSATKH